MCEVRSRGGETEEEGQAGRKGDRGSWPPAKANNQHFAKEKS